MTETRAEPAQAANETRVAKLAAIAFKAMTPACEAALAFVWAREAAKTRAKIARHNASLGGGAERKRSSGQYTAEEWAAKLEAERQANRNAILRAVKHYPMTIVEIAAATGYDRKQKADFGYHPHGRLDQAHRQARPVHAFRGGTMNFRDIWRSGYVTRYHANPDVPAETLAEHHCRVAQILYAICTPSTELIFAALHHDVGELIVGDLPWPFKRDYPELARQHREAEDKAKADILGCTFNISARERDMLHLADRIAAHLYGERHNPGPDWQRDWVDIYNMANRLGVSLDPIMGAAE